MSTESDRLAKDVACLKGQEMPFTLVSKIGFNCDVWRSIGRIIEAGRARPLDFILKVGKRRCTLREVQVLAKQYRTLRTELDEIVPESIFVATEINGVPSAIVFARTCKPWFDLAHPVNREEAVPLLRHQPRSRHQLAHFVQCARRWLDERGMVIDLYGGENLVLDRSEGVRYLDSFYPFFYLDLLTVIDEVDEGLEFRIEQSIQRLDYLEWLVEQTMQPGDQPEAGAQA